MLLSAYTLLSRLFRLPQPYAFFPANTALTNSFVVVWLYYGVGPKAQSNFVVIKPSVDAQRGLRAVPREQYCLLTCAQESLSRALLLGAFELVAQETSQRMCHVTYGWWAVTSAYALGRVTSDVV
jgi:hypothetical protein